MPVPSLPRGRGSLMDRGNERDGGEMGKVDGSQVFEWFDYNESIDLILIRYAHTHTQTNTPGYQRNDRFTLGEVGGAKMDTGREGGLGSREGAPQSQRASNTYTFTEFT
jgi:hypothetical protein